jgi:nitroreductase
MNIFDAIEQRRSIKHYDSQHKMREEDILQLVDMARLSPTSFNIQNWRFVVVQDPELRQKIRNESWDQAQVTEASVLFILCADLKSWDKEPMRYWRNAPEEVQNMIVPMIGNFYRGHEQTQRDEAMRSVGMAAQTIMLTAKAMGYDSCPMIGFDADAVAKLINLPEDHVIGMMLPIGKKIKDPEPRSGPLDRNDILIKDSF